MNEDLFTGATPIDFNQSASLDEQLVGATPIDFGQVGEAEPTTFKGRVQGAVKKRKAETEDIISKSYTGIIPRSQQAFQVVGQGAGLATDIFGAAVEPIIKPVVKSAIGGVVSERIAEEKLPIIGKKIAVENAIVKGGLEALSQGMEAYSNWRESSPKNKNIARNIESVFNLANLAGMFSGVEGAGKTGVGIFESGISKAKAIPGFFGKIGKAVVSKEYRSALSATTPEEFDSILSATRAKVADINAPHPSSIFNPQVDNAVKEISKLRSEASKASTAAKITGKAKILPGESGVKTMKSELMSSLRDKGATIRGNKVISLPGATVTLTGKDIDVINDIVLPSLQKLSGQKASKVTTGLERMYNEVTTSEGISSELEAIVNKSTSAARKSLRQEIPALGETAERYEDVNDVYERIRSITETEKGAKRLLEKSVSDADVFKLVQDIDRLTNNKYGLSNKAALIRFTEAITNPSLQQRFATAIASKSKAKLTDIINESLGGIVKGGVRKIISPERGAREIIRESRSIPLTPKTK